MHAMSAAAATTTTTSGGGTDDDNDGGGPPPIRKQIVYFVRHAEALHNVEEQRAIEEALSSGKKRVSQLERARRAVLRDPSLKDAPLSEEGFAQARNGNVQLSLLMKFMMNNQNQNNNDNNDNNPNQTYLPPRIVFVSPLRRALMTATELFGDYGPSSLSKNDAATASATASSPSSGDGATTATKTRFVAVEALREKRTGLSCDERSPVETLRTEFPHVDFSDLDNAVSPPEGEDNDAVRARAKLWMERVLPLFANDDVAVVSHKGWLREMRQTLRNKVDEGRLAVDFDIENWDQTLFGNAEIRIAEFGWGRRNNDGGGDGGGDGDGVGDCDGDGDDSPKNELVSIVSRSVQNIVSGIVMMDMDETNQ